MRTSTRRIRVGCVAVGVLVALAGCGTDESAAPGAATHTMRDGTVMEGETHHHGEHPEAAGGPSEAARMVCAGQVVDDVTRIMDLEDAAAPRSQWAAPMFSCTFELPQGPLVLSVHDADDRAAGMAHFRALRTSRPGAEPLGGVYSLGLPAYETPSGTVAFVRDGKTLEVDATGLSGRAFGVDDTMTRTEVAYAVATSVLACWTAHT